MAPNGKAASTKQIVAIKSSCSKQNKWRPEVKVVTCPDFTSKKRQKQPRPAVQGKQSSTSNNKELLDWNDTIKEIRNYGAQAFQGQQKRNFEKEQYKLLTGRAPKQQHVPLPIARAIKKKHAERQAQVEREAKESGVVTAISNNNNAEKDKKQRSINRNDKYGPAPSIGFMKNGILRVKQDKK